MVVAMVYLVLLNKVRILVKLLKKQRRRRGRKLKMMYPLY
jgi:hypothetical protein